LIAFEIKQNDIDAIGQNTFFQKYTERIILLN